MAYIQFQLRRGTAAEWSSANPVLAVAEMGIETDTKMFKIGDGTTAWNSLAYGGFSGYSGKSGYSGYSGISGFSGISGYSGISGFSGSGISGYSGYSGFSGISGFSGSGISGFSGYSGFSGISGFSGSGVSGYSGFSGISGFSGSGISGFSGYSGFSGISGYSGSGISGFSGWSGISGFSGTNTTLNATADSATATLYPTMVGGTGTAQTVKANTGFAYNASTGVLSVGTAITGGTTLTLSSTTTNAISLDSGTTGAVNIGTNANAKTITLGNTAVAGSIVLNSNITVGAGKTFKLSGSSSGTITLQTAAAAGTWSLTLPTSAGSSGQALVTDGAGVLSWGAAGATITDDTTTDATRYLVFEDVTTGSMTSVGVSSTKLYFNPSTGTMSATNFNSLSDVTLKKDVTQITDAVTTLRKIDGVSFSWKDNNKKSYGVIAQEIEKILPDVVETNDQGIKAVNYSAMTGFLIEAIKELSAEIEALKSNK